MYFLEAAFVLRKLRTQDVETIIVSQVPRDIVLERREMMRMSKQITCIGVLAAMPLQDV
jgi:hypothetical protein